MDPLLEAMNVELNVPTDIADTLEDAASQFLLAGGTFTLSDWAKMSHDTRAAFIRANKEIEADRTLRMGLVTGTPENAAEAIRDLDGGDVAAEVAVATMAKKAAETIKKRGRK